MSTVTPQDQDHRFNAADLHQIVNSTFVEQVEFHRSIDSTNNRALEIAREGRVNTPLVVLADQQNEGRGRGTNQWWAQQGALTFSLVIATDAMGIPKQRWPQASLATGLAVCEALEDFLDEPEIHVKWPNDVYVQQRKVCGILIELPPEQKQMLVIGVGINVNNSAQHAPPELRSSAIALYDAVGHELPLIEVLLRVLGNLDRRLNSIGRRDEDLRTRWQERCLLTNRKVHVDVGTRSVIGLCRGIDDEGALVVETVNETERCFAGVVTYF